MTNIRNALMQAAGTAASGGATYVEDVFSNTLYVGNGSGTLNTITTGLDLADKGGAVWIKGRDMGTGNHALYDSERGDSSSVHSYKWLVPNETYEENNGSANLFQLHSLTSTGFKVQYTNTINEADRKFASWSFAKQTGFFDVVKYTGNGSARTISHNLGSVPGCIICKSTSATADWITYHNGANKGTNAQKYHFKLNGTNAKALDNDIWDNTQPTATEFSLDTGPNANGTEYVAYLFASGADSASQIFGDDGDEAIIKTGSVTTTSGGALSVNCGFEPQWIMIKIESDTGGWYMMDTMRGLVSTSISSGTKSFLANTDAVEDGISNWGVNATGFTGSYGGAADIDLIYIAIRRGPMKEPSAGTDVYAGDKADTSVAPMLVSNFPVDLVFPWRRTDITNTNKVAARLLGNNMLNADDTAAAYADSDSDFDFQNGYYSWAANNTVYWGNMLRRYPKVFDTVVYEGNGNNSPFRTITHNLGVAPELVIIKNIDQALHWGVNQNTGDSDVDADEVYLNLDGVYSNSNGLTASATTVTLNAGWGGTGQINNNGDTHLMLMFASLDGISKVGAYTGTGNDLNVTDLGAAARFVLIKRTDTSGDWYVFDTTQGIVSGDDPYVLMNSTAAQVTNTDYIDPLSSGFTITSSATADLNASGGKYLYLAFAQDKTMSEYRLKSDGSVKTKNEVVALFPNTSIPKVWTDQVCSDLGIDVVFESPKPTSSEAYKHYVRNGVEQNDNDQWVQAWVEQDMFEDTTVDGVTTTKAEHEAAYQATLDADAAAAVRTKRDGLLAETDFYALSDVTMTDAMKTHRQALRDITAHSNFPHNLTDDDWPEKP